MTIGELKERIDELEAADNSEVIFYDPISHEAIQIDTIECGIFDPSKEEFVYTYNIEDRVGIPCVALFI